MAHAGPDAVITVLLKSNARLGLIFLDVKRAADSISKII
jgi:predicted regulator of Ras-like GTPase activity (Roadblock/LC7/MglB family)